MQQHCKQAETSRGTKARLDNPNVGFPASSAARVTGVAPTSGDLDCAVYESGYHWADWHCHCMQAVQCTTAPLSLVWTGHWMVYNITALYLMPLGKPLPLPGWKGGYLLSLPSSNGGGSFLSLFVIVESSLVGPFCESSSDSIFISSTRRLVFA